MIDMRRQLYAIWARLCAGSLDYIGGADPLPQPLTREEEAELLQKLPTDDGTVRSILIERNLRLVVFIARKFESSGVGLEDLQLAQKDFITLRITAAHSDKNAGGVTIFGRGFGNYDQNILVSLYYCKQS